MLINPHNSLSSTFYHFHFIHEYLTDRDVKYKVTKLITDRAENRACASDSEANPINHSVDVYWLGLT